MSPLWRHGSSTGVRVENDKWTLVSRSSGAWTDVVSYDLKNALSETGVVHADRDRIDVTRDGRRAAFTVAYGDSQFVQVVDTESGAVVRMIGVGSRFTETNFGDVRFSADGRVLVCTYPYAEDPTVNRVMVRLACDDFMTTFAEVTAADVGADANSTLFGARLAIACGNDNTYIVSALSLSPRCVTSFKFELDAAGASILASPIPFGTAISQVGTSPTWGLLGVEVSDDANAIIVAGSDGVDVFDVHSTRRVQTCTTKLSDMNSVVTTCANGNVTVAVGSRVIHSTRSVSSAAAARERENTRTMEMRAFAQRGRSIGTAAEQRRLERVRASSPDRTFASRPVQRLRAISPSREPAPSPSHAFQQMRMQQKQQQQQRAAVRVVVERPTSALRDERSYAVVARPVSPTTQTRSGLRVRAMSPTRK